MRDEFILHLKVLFVFLLLILSCKNNTSEIRHPSGDHISYQYIVDSIYNSNKNAIGIMIHIEAPKKGISWSGCSGFSDKDKKIKLHPDQPALIASCTKPFVAASILRLQEANLLTIEDPIKSYLTDKTTKLFESDGYELDLIKIKHLLQHRSGINDYVGKRYFDKIDEDKQHRWTRDEQLEMTINMTDYLGAPPYTYNYSDVNYLLATEIIEGVSDRPFYSAMRQLLKYDELELNNTWFYTLEIPSEETKPMVHQYWRSRGWDSYDIDPSFDLYGGGGIATTTEELAKFFYNLFQSTIITDPDVFSNIFDKGKPITENDNNNYSLGIAQSSIQGYTYYTHGGFWGTTVVYIPQLETSIAIYILDREERQLRNETLDSIIKMIGNKK